MHLITGQVHVHPRGFGFVTPEHTVKEMTTDLYISGSNLNQAMHGDRVVDAYLQIAKAYGELKKPKKQKQRSFRKYEVRKMPEDRTKNDERHVINL